MDSRDRPGEGGFTLVELLVVLVLVGIVSSIVTAGLVRGMEASRKAQARVIALTDLEKGLERVSRELRVADPLLVPSGLWGCHDDPTPCAPNEDPMFNAGAVVMREGVKLRYRYYLDPADPTRLLEDIEDVATGTPIATRTFIENVENLALGVPLFTYFDFDHNQLTTKTLSDGTTVISTVGAAAQIELTLIRGLPEQQPVSVSTNTNVRSTRAL